MEKFIIMEGYCIVIIQLIKALLIKENFKEIASIKALKEVFLKGILKKGVFKDRELNTLNLVFIKGNLEME